MSETTISILLMIHLTFITVWIGSQILVGAAVVPTIRRIQDGRTRLDALEVFTRRFNLIAWFSMLVITLTGGMMVSDRIGLIEASVGGGSIFDARWGWIFVIKMTLWTLMVGVVGLHSFILGPRQMDLNRAALENETDASRARIRRLQRRSIATSAAGLLLAILVLGAGAFLSNHNFSAVAA